ncbi:high-affinity choline transporter 1 isoform X2 [Lepeophtheirus salmonis]|uniref:high-affinity choline transporter 1 isoform X2 n=1 Tax=Lepeophtheirus salmonis TaxID=72036 RepID=UPI001AEB08A5|nr:high-affinity choline transporter 1-like isoform X2 [Lepeophtheirus salmonis]
MVCCSTRIQSQYGTQWIISSSRNEKTSVCNCCRCTPRVIWLHYRSTHLYSFLYRRYMLDCSPPNCISVLIGTDQTLMICISAALAVLYTLVGGMYSVAYTDVLQLMFVIFGLWISLPFVLSSDSIDLSALSFKDWSGNISKTNCITYIDTFIMLLCGGIPWQGYYQRALALRTTRQAQLLSYISAFICITFMIPPIFIGGAAKSSLTLRKIIGDDFVKVLPVTIGELSPKFVTYSALGAVSAASMSSMDSAVLSGASYFSHNVYISLFRPTAGRLETMLVFRVCLIFLGVVAAIIAINSTSIYGLWSLAGDLSFAIVFPQFLSSILWPLQVNWFGSIVSIVIGGSLRVLVGEQDVGIPSIIPFWTFEGTTDSIVPIKSMIMLCSLGSHLIASNVYNYIIK